MGDDGARLRAVGELSVRSIGSNRIGRVGKCLIFGEGLFVEFFAEPDEIQTFHSLQTF
jgi:hypothetical protein